MPRWRELPEELDPRVRDFTERLRELVERAGLSASAVAERTGYERAAWGRFLGGRALPPRDAVAALAEATGADADELDALRDAAERASRGAEARHDRAATPPRGAPVRPALAQAARRDGASATAPARAEPGARGVGEAGGSARTDASEPAATAGGGPGAGRRTAPAPAASNGRTPPRSWPVLDRERALGSGPTAALVRRPGARRAPAGERAVAGRQAATDDEATADARPAAGPQTTGRPLPDRGQRALPQPRAPRSEPRRPAAKRSLLTARKALTRKAASNAGPTASGPAPEEPDLPAAPFAADADATADAAPAAAAPKATRRPGAGANEPALPADTLEARRAADLLAAMLKARDAARAKSTADEEAGPSAATPDETAATNQEVADQAEAGQAEAEPATASQESDAAESGPAAEPDDGSSSGAATETAPPPEPAARAGAVKPKAGADAERAKGPAGARPATDAAEATEPGDAADDAPRPAPRLAWPRALATPTPTPGQGAPPRTPTGLTPRAAAGARPARQSWAHGPAEADEPGAPARSPVPAAPVPAAAAATGASARTGAEPAPRGGSGAPPKPVADGEPAAAGVPGGRWHRLGMFAAGVVGTLLVVAAAMLVFDVRFGDDESNRSAPTTTPSAPLPDGVRCTGAACGGKDPEAMGCGGTHAKTTTDAMVGGVYVEVRYSKVCGAAWARIAQAAPGDEVRVRGGAAGAERGQERRRTADADGDAYTAMVPVRSAKLATACVTRTTGETGCTSS
ncbi:helix-turn-helix domain-containing protein [Streptomyces buecherae]|uniref:DUF2690 domain-containing protein n=1 Tax=Streptomyces buecherae TaxID=2763006 RepID=A0A7H8N7B9_9ACTN|nr:XRE family transcriptional regulator [Streptomyces buecherae]QKW50377.1 DUF2690 domain-containing protein [Streptomyces buecherae]